MLRRIIFFTLMIFANLNLISCSKTNPNQNDPLEVFNREMYGFNKTFDTALVKPAAYMYREYLPYPFQAGIGNFFDNLREISNFANDLLQFKFAYAMNDVARLCINSTVGILGFFDPATTLGLEHRKQDFGQTLYHWGYKQSAYLVLPILGPSSIRDGIGIGVDYFALSIWPWIDSDWWKLGLLTVDGLDLRARVLGHETVIDVVALDEYSFIRDAYFQRRRYLFNEQSDTENEFDPYSENVGDLEGKASTKTIAPAKAP